MMKVKPLIVLLVLLSSVTICNAQYLFSGSVDTTNSNSTAYLSLVEDYRKMSGVYQEQIINKVKIDSGYFEFSGDNLDVFNRIYRVHIDNCNDDELNANHFNGQCPTSREVIFIANNKDTINLPISFEDQVFCSIQSNSEHSKAFFKIDSLKELMTYDYSSYRSEANRKLNDKKWFAELQQFGEQLNEPLAELYIYKFLSDRSGDLYEHYLKDVTSNNYYDELFDRLNNRYSSSSYAKQYELEYTSDKYALESTNKSSFKWKYFWYSLLGLSLVLNLFFLLRLKKNKENKSTKLKDQLTKQEQKILDLILQNKTNKEIAQEIFVSVSTVKTHINNLYKKLNVDSREQVKLLFNK